ncbi:hypothetical protein M427DRAFT_40232 [Gonapodya prolifera JEL478]|uniref:Uncharacterized protein n=1 Tax=Gonapodya prolifera (strain JEL478) TaxID=1344416 RepID=A0A139B019_GONPJ|nr:hypothetical protein M427DRAFT_40232 [Gonapodya prolifera JEL478]|eukprot:KXS22314.1 hypothetical protein M427DRAFT_40232 [Gonapodya prolifera JEL478]
MDTAAPPSHTEIVAAVKLLKQTTNITAKQMAEGYGVTRHTIYNWLAAPDEPKLETRGRKSELTPEEDLEVAEWMLEDPEWRAKQLSTTKNKFTITFIVFHANTGLPPMFASTYSDSFGVVSGSNYTAPWRLSQTSYGNVNMRENKSFIGLSVTGTCPLGP